MGNMTLIQAILCGVVYWLAVGNLPFVGLWSLQRPLVCGTLVGCILGHPVEGAVIGATINLVYLGFMSAGGSMPADMGLAGVLGTAYAICGGLMPCLGIAITLQYIYKGESKIFLFAGFLLAVYSGLPLLTLGIIAFLVAVVYVQVTDAKAPAAATANGAAYDDEDDEEDD